MSEGPRSPGEGSPSPGGLFAELGARRFPGHVGIEIVRVERGSASGRLEATERHLAPNDYLHAGAVVALADTVCGYGCMGSLPEGRTGFTTIELKTNFVATARGGTITCDGRLVDGGRTTQVWDARVEDESGRQLALFRCTQLLL